MADIVILRPNWPEMYNNLTFCPLEKTSKDSHSFSEQSLLLVLFLLIAAFRFKKHAALDSSLPIVLLCSFLSVILSPLIFLLLCLFFLYREIVKTVLQLLCPGFRCLMDGADAFWSLDEDNSRAVINILAFIERGSCGNCQDIKFSLKKVFEDRLLSENQTFKLKCHRKLSNFGYTYWEELPYICLEDYIRWMDLDEVTEESITKFVSDNSNKPLPHNHQSLWEVLVAKQSLERNGKDVFPVLFRMHHSIGDGISLVNLFLNSFTDASVSHKLKLIQRNQKNGSTQEFSSFKNNLSVPYARSRRRSSLFFNEELKKFNEHCINGVTTLLQKITVILFAPYVILSQALFGIDNNIMHKTNLVGQKHLSWASGEETLARVKFIKDKSKCHFTDVLLLVISNVFSEYFSNYDKPPVDITLVIPARIQSEKKLTVKSMPSNGFTVGVLKLPIEMPKKFQVICKSADKLRTGPDYLVNYWFLKVICTYIPIVLLKGAMESKQATAAMSNIPGPDSLAKVDGNTIHDLVFWLPNKDTTGVGVSILSYAGNLNLGLAVDHAVIPYKEDVKHLVNRMVEEIDKLYFFIKEQYS